MSLVLHPYEWEHHFTEEAILVEELLSSGDFMFLSQSKIRIALENKILSWEKYKNWIQKEHAYSSLKNDINQQQIEILKNKYTENLKTFSHHDIWSEDLIAIEMWDEQLIIIGLFPPEKLMSIPNSIFILCPPMILKQIFSADENQQTENGHQNQTQSSVALLDIDQGISKPININFSKLKNDINITQTNLKKEDTSTEFSVWNQIENNHLANSDKARKQFDAYLVLKIVENKTTIFKMDDDLAKEDLNESLFKYEMNGENPFSKVYKNGITESFNLAQMGLVILDFRYACITPLKIGKQVFGFLIGFKTSEMLNIDEIVLDNISLDNVA